MVKKQYVITANVSEDEHAAITQAAKNAGESVSAYAKDVLLNRIHYLPPVTTSPQGDLPE